MSQSPLLTCRELIEFISEYLDGTLAAAPRREFERHLRACPSCVNYLDGFRRTIALSKAALAPPESSADAVAPEALVRAVRAARRGAPSTPRPGPDRTEADEAGAC